MIHVWVCLDVPKDTINAVVLQIGNRIYWIFLLLDIPPNTCDGVFSKEHISIREATELAGFALHTSITVTCPELCLIIEQSPCLTFKK